MSKKITVTIEIEKPPRDIYSFITNMENLPFWSDVKLVKRVSGNGEVGTIYNLTMNTILSKKVIPVEVTQKLAYTNFAYRDTTTSIENETGYVLKDEGDRTEVTAYKEVGLGSLAYLLTLGFMTDRDTKKQLEDLLTSLKEFIERE